MAIPPVTYMNIFDNLSEQQIMIILGIVGVAIVLCFLLKTIKRIIIICISALLAITATGAAGEIPDIAKDYISDAGTSIISNAISNGKDTAGDTLSGIVDAAKGALGDLSTSTDKKEGPTAEPVSGDSVLVHYIDVGQADSILIQDNGHNMLIDCGNANDDGIVLDYLYGLGIENLDYFVGTHPHEDHIGCAATILKNVNCENVILSPATNTTACYNKMVQIVDEKGYNEIRVNPDIVGTTYSLGDGSFQILGPISLDKDELNNDSVVLRYVYGDTSFMFQGDAEREEEQAILDAGYDVSSTVYKVGHHGSDSSTSYPWLREVAPTLAVIPVGEGNTYGHPTDGTLSKLRDAEVTAYRTDLNGTVVITSDGHNVSVDTEK